ncbi:hypothetical protein AHAS_Ahas04G0225900 [Arachis hypogaea]
MPTDHALFYASDILRQNRSAINNVKFDVHGRLMKAYKQVPEWRKSSSYSHRYRDKMVGLLLSLLLDFFIGINSKAFFFSLLGVVSLFLLPSISSLLELEGDSEAIEDYLGENAPTLTTANLKAFVNKQMKSEKEASWTNMEGAQSVVHRGAGKKRKIA